MSETAVSRVNVNINLYTGIVLAVVMVMCVQSLDRPIVQCGGVVL